MLEDDISSILRESPRIWTVAEGEQVKQYFREQRPAVSAELAKALWRYWRDRYPTEALFKPENDARAVEDNLALLLHARAYGEDIPETGDSIFAQYWNEYKNLYEVPEGLSRLNWGPRAALAQEVLVGLDAPIMHVWAFVQGKKLQQLLIVGEGLPEIRRLVSLEAFRTSLHVHGVANDILNIGVLRIELPGSPVTPWITPVPIIGDLKNPLPPREAQTAEIALIEMLAFLKSLERNSGLVRVHQVQINTQTALTNTLNQLTQDAARNREQAFLWKNSDAQELRDLVTLIPYWQITRAARVLNLAFSMDLLEKIAPYKQLQEKYQYATAQRILIDLDERRDYFKREIERLEAEKKDFEEADPLQRNRIWGKTIKLTFRFDDELALNVKLVEPEEMPIEQFFHTNLPALIKRFTIWKERIERNIQSIQEAYNRDDAPVRRFAASRFLDAAMRGRTPDESKAIQAAFEEWRELVQPLLRFEWRCFLQREGIDEQQVFTHHTFFHTWSTTTRAHLIMSPFTLFDRDRSIAVFDQTHKVVEVRDATDYKKDFLSGAASATKSPDQNWQDLKALAGQDKAAKEDFAAALRKSLQQAPLEITERILETLVASNLVDQLAVDFDARTQSDGDMLEPFVIGKLQRRELEDHLKSAREKTKVSRAILQAFMAMPVMAFQTARQALDISVRDHRLQAQLHIVRAILECLVKGELYEQALPEIFENRRLFPPPEIQSALDDARDADEEFVSGWIVQLAREETRKGAPAYLLDGLPKTRDVCSPAEYAALLARSATEAVRMAHELEQAALTLAEDEEYVSTVFAKLGWVLEDMVLPDYGSAPHGELINLIEVLSGEELSKYKGIGGL